MLVARPEPVEGRFHGISGPRHALRKRLWCVVRRSFPEEPIALALCVFAPGFTEFVTIRLMSSISADLHASVSQDTATYGQSATAANARSMFLARML